ncbi:MAG: PQQ-binding-like beta-propeller repeat protein, partial [Clostridia bacterium]|nr:PQQ-binding-like beta-propeller repeat protein [Clostridia bacterium]
NYLNDIDGILNVTTSKTDGGGIDSTPAATRLFELNGNKLQDTHLLYRNFDGSVPSEGAEWHVKVAGHGEFAEPILSNGNLYVATVDDGYPKNCAITSLNSENGQANWVYETKNSIRNSFAISNGKLVAQDIEGRVYCLDAQTGEEIWVKETKLMAAANTGQNVLIEENRVYCGGAQKSVCLSLTDGSLIWEKTNDQACSSPCRMFIDGDKLIVGANWDELIAYNKYNGKRVWANKKDGLRYLTATPVIYDGKMYVAATSILFEVDKETGKIIRSRDTGINLDTATSPYIVDSIGYYATAKDGVVAFDMQTFEKVYQCKSGKALVFTSPYTSGDVSTVESGVIPYGDNLIFGASDGYIYMTDKKLQILAKYNVSSPVLSQLATADGYIY